MNKVSDSYTRLKIVYFSREFNIKLDHNQLENECDQYPIP